MTVESLEMPLGEAVKVKPRLHWRSQGVGGTRSTGSLTREAAHMEHREGSSPRGKCVVGSKVGREELSEPFDLRHGTTRFGVYSGGSPS